MTLPMQTRFQVRVRCCDSLTIPSTHERPSAATCDAVGNEAEARALEELGVRVRRVWCSTGTAASAVVPAPTAAMHAELSDAPVSSSDCAPLEDEVIGAWAPKSALP